MLTLARTGRSQGEHLPAEEANPAGRAFGGPVAWLGALAVTASAAWLVATGAEALRASHQLARAVWTGQGLMVGPVLLAVTAAVFLAERRWPAVPRPARSRAHIVDAGYLLLFALLGPLITLLGTGFAVAVERHAPFLQLGRLALGPRVVVSAVILLGIDAMNWVAHAGNHRWMALWRFHALHHSQEDMSVLTTFRTHPLSHASYLLAAVPALVLEASGTVPAAALIAYGCLVTLPHANLRWSFGPLGRVLVSPAYHRLHHAQDPIGGRRAVNFGFVLVCWDRLAGTAVWPSDPRLPSAGAVPTGLRGRPVPIEQATAGPGGRALGRVVAAQLWQPFRPPASPTIPTPLEER